MYFHKIRHPSNFAFPQKFDAKSAVATIHGKRYRYQFADLGSDVFHLQVNGPAPLSNKAQSGLQKLPKRPSQSTLSFGARGEVILHGADKRPLLQSLPKQAFGICGSAWMLQFHRPDGTQFYGMGEKNIGFERSGKRTKFWNTDVWGDFSHAEMQNASTDPMYVTVPYLVIKQGNSYVGILVDNPFPSFMDTGSNYLFRPQLDPSEPPSFFLGADEGLASAYFLVGPSLHELTCKFQKLCGTTPLPPLWALGHHQCRWGYRGTIDLQKLAREFIRHRIPNDGLWLDIDYMDRFKVFTFSPDHFKNARREIAVLRKKNRHVVPILDPGVKLEKGYPVYDDGIKKGVFCQNPNGDPYIGFVWPGRTVFPDFSLKDSREWWAGYVKTFAETGVSGAWLDMNDPSVGAVELDDMRFNKGREPHAMFHNQYALGMAKASQAGFLAARPNERPFLLARSAFTGSSKYTAIWTGDNFANRHHLKNTVQVTLNLALSGIPFNGPDVAGFGGNSTPDLFASWYKAGFLFPFFRNHSIEESTFQEPWAFGHKPLQVARHYIRTRYKLLPYLYNLFIDQEETGTAILRPLFYDFADTRSLPLGTIDDQFLVGPSILQAPVYTKEIKKREVVLPGKTGWFAAHEGRWIEGNRRVTTHETPTSTPLYLREGAIIPMQEKVRTSNDNDLSHVEFHLFVRSSTRGISTYTYRFDDGHTFDYRNGKRTSFTLTVSVKGKTVRVKISDLRNGFKPCVARFVVYDKFQSVLIEGVRKSQELAFKSLQWDFVGKRLRALATSSVTVQ